MCITWTDMSRREVMAVRDRGIRYISARVNERRVLIHQIRHIACLSLTACLLLAAETTILSRLPLPLFGWGAAAPALGLLLAMAIGFFYGEREGGVAGLCIGLLADSTGGGIMLLPLFYFLSGFGTGFAARRRLSHNLPSFVVFSLVGGIMESIATAAENIASDQAIPPLIWMWRGLVPIIIWTVLFSPAVYLSVWGIRRLLTPR